MTVQSLKFCVVLALLALPGSIRASDNNPAFIHLDDTLNAGRTLWVNHCATCHGYGIAGAPIPMKPSQWSARLEKPVATLYSHAINGFFGPDDTHMPARGGNPDLSDADIKAAVDYMVALALFYSQEKR